ncbi:hypothetical protein [Burkholderia diffusa]|nr:hypothetical protein [Burkholderia diffusa]
MPDGATIRQPSGHIYPEETALNRFQPAGHTAPRFRATDKVMAFLESL